MKTVDGDEHQTQWQFEIAAVGESLTKHLLQRPEFRRIVQHTTRRRLWSTFFTVQGEPEDLERLRTAVSSLQTDLLAWIGC